jgi:predicted transcriptional regulator
MQLTLPLDQQPDVNGIRIVRLNGADPRQETDHWRAFRERIVSHEERYPGIERWLRTKVAAGLGSPGRQAFLAYVGERAVASAVLKKGQSAKICHLSISEEHQDLGLGNVFFSLMTLEAGPSAQAIHFTLPEGLWAERSAFFASFGFAEAVPARNQYRLFENELRCSAPWPTVWSAVMQKLPTLLQRFSFDGRPGENRMLLNLRAEEARAILGGRIRVAIRGCVSSRWSGCRVVLYAGTPIDGLVGEAHVAQVVSGAPQDVWASFGAALGCSRSWFDASAAGRHRISAIVLSQVTPYPRPVPRKDAEHLVGVGLRVPPPHARLGVESPWARLASLAVPP